jgi:iron complex outermembrane receptor protein
VQASFGYLNYLLTDPGKSTLCRYDANGDPCYSPRTPKYNGSLGVQYAIPLAGGSSITPRLDVQYQSTIYFTTNNQGVQPGYTLLNGHLTWQSANKSWQVGLYGLNLTDKVYFLGKLSLISLLGREEGNVAPPREIGIDIKRSFY